MDKFYQVVISRHAFKAMVRMAKGEFPNETGSSLIGSYSADGFTAFVLDVAPKPVDSSASRFSFIRGIAGMTDFFQMIANRFQGKRFYIGEWHSHPLSGTSSSGTDQATHAEIAGDRNVHCPEVVMIIIGGDFTDSVSVGVSVYSAGRGRVVLNPNPK